MEFIEMCQAWKCRTSGMSSQETRTEIHNSCVKNIKKVQRNPGSYTRFEAYTLDP